MGWQFIGTAALQNERTIIFGDTHLLVSISYHLGWTGVTYDLGTQDKCVFCLESTSGCVSGSHEVDICRSCLYHFVYVISQRVELARPDLKNSTMDHFPTNWGRPVCTLPYFYVDCSPLRQRNDAYDAYGTFPLPHRPSNNTKDAFVSAVQHTQ